MANRIPSFKPARDTSPQTLPLRAPDSPPRERHPLSIEEDEPLVPRETTRISVKKRSYEVDTGTPPSKEFKPPLVPRRTTRISVKKRPYEIDTGTPPSKKIKLSLLETSRLFSQRSILLTPQQLATPPAHRYPLDSPFPSPQTPNHPSNQSTLPKATVNHSKDQAHTMPYNNTAIPPPEEITGAASLPLARVKKILHIDEEIMACSNNGAFAITIATEMFIRYLAEQALNVVKSEKKPRRNIQYKDMANAVARIDSLQFLEDVIPRTSTFREFKAKKASKATRGNQPLQNGQTTLDAPRSLPRRPIGTNEQNGGAVDDGKMSDGTISEADHEETRAAAPNKNGGLVFEHYEPNGTRRRDESGDVEMS